MKDKVKNWNRVKEILPPMGLKVLVFGNNEIDVAFYDRRELWMWDKSHAVNHKITHWQLLPEKPQEEPAIIFKR